MLDRLYDAFDLLAEKHGVFKVRFLNTFAIEAYVINLNSFYVSVIRAN
jgi:hypothetical protein